MDTVQFSYGKRAIFPKVKEIKRLHGGVAVYAAHARARIDAEIGEKSRFRMKTRQALATGQDRRVASRQTPSFLSKRQQKGSKKCLATAWGIRSRQQGKG